MKINVWPIIIDHLSTLRDDVSKNISIPDIITFFVGPVLGGSIGYLLGIKTSKDLYNVLITFFGIFVALLLNFQVAAFGIYNRKWSSSKDEKLSRNQMEELKIRKQLLREINANISYLILVSIISIALVFYLYVVENTGRIASAFLWVTCIHFILTLLMVIKRSHILFKKEYDEV